MLSLMLIGALSLSSIGTYGKTYDIAEPDALQEIAERAEKIDREKVKMELDQKFRTHRPKDMTKLKPATKSTSYLLDMTYALDYDIPRVDSQGKIVGILYPKGFKYNPLDFLPADPPPLVIFDGDSAKEKAWVKKNYKGKHVMLVTTGGNWATLPEEMGAPVFYLKSLMVEKLRLINTISIVYKQGRNIKVEVRAINEKP